MRFKLDFKENNKPNSDKRFFLFIPLLFGIILTLGVFIGYFIHSRLSGRFSVNNSSSNSGDKIASILDYIHSNYVDTIDKKNLEEKAITSLLHGLDPHSDYIPASELQQVNEPMQGNFEGIGVEFNIINDTVTVITPINGGPSEKAGILAGDKIVLVEKEKVAGVKITNKKIFSLLRGKKGTSVNISIRRGGSKNLQQYKIVRGEIPLYSVDVSYMVNKNVGYIKISRFAMTTYDEFIKAYQALQRKGMRKMILDLRGNPGGVLPAAVNICDEFLSKGYNIVYTEGKASPKRIHKSTSTGGFERGEIVVLIDEGSASASEIVAGALQDNDRAVIVGRRSFGKGLVQEQIDLDDGSAIRLTIARYYTPTGRCIQKPYTDDKEAYYEEEFNRIENGELFSADSIKFPDSLKFRTPNGKIVYGGGGIMPDIFVPIDTSGRTSFLRKVLYSGQVNTFAFTYADQNREKLNKLGSASKFISDFKVDDALFAQLISHLEKSNIKGDISGIKKSEKILRNQLKALIGRSIFNNEAYFPVLNSEDKTILKAVEILNQKSAL
ncbi:MAG: S41 family peptidase [Bacteroidota bacterium]|jgi:carboxyl-terminal processing protease